MKDQILKMAKVKSEKEFYKKFPTEEAFMAKYGKALKKAAMGKAMVARQLTQLTDFANPPQAQVGTFMGGEQDASSNVSFADIYDATDYQTTGMTNQMRNEQANVQAQQQIAANSAKKNDGGGNKDIENIGKIANVATMLMKKGGRIPMLQGGGPVGGSNLWGPNQPLMGGGPTGAPGSPANPSAGMYPIQPGNNPSNASIQQGFAYDPSGGQDGDGGNDLLNTVASYAPGAEQLVGNYQKIKGAISAREKSNQFVDTSRLAKEAAGTRGEISKRRYVRPEDMRFDPNQMNKPKGEGTNYLAKNGTRVGGNPTEIQNTYAPNSIYTDLEYTPLRDTNIKQFQDGGFADTFNNPIMAGVNIATDLTTAIINAGTKKRNQQGFQNLGASALQQGAQQIQGQNNAFMEDGGWVSNDWMPQVITTFGEHKIKDLLKPPHDADMLRAGGHLKEYTPPSERAMETFQMGGELQTHWGGYTEAASENPYLPDGGVTYMPRGNYHSQSDGEGNTGIGITFGDNPVEVERGEPMVKLEDGGTGEKNLVVLGALDIPNYALADLKKDAKGKKFKTYGTELTKDTNKQNKMVEKATEKINDLEVLTPFDNLEMNSLQAQILGGNMKLKDIAAETQKLGALQQAIHDSANEFGYEDVAKFNKDVKANRVQIGNSQPDTQSAQKGGSFKVKGKGNYLDYNPLGETNNPIFTAGRYEKEWVPKVEKAFADPMKANEIIKGIETYTGEGAEKAKKKLAEAKTLDQKVNLAKKLATDRKVGVYHDILNNIIETVSKDVTPTQSPVKQPPVTNPSITDVISPISPITTDIVDEGYIPGKGYDWQDIYNTVLPYVRPSNQLPLDPTQLAGEMFALSANQVEPVFAQSYKPMLSTPFDISLQDQLNANQADYNATQRLVGYNPAALSQLNAQKYAANSAVLGQQTRLNQAEKARVYEANRNILNDAQLKNLAIYDQQMVRQSQALSNTKAQTQAALNSISDKYSKNQLENRTLGVYENLYNYRYDNRGRAINVNPLQRFNLEGSGSARTKQSANQLPEGWEVLYDNNGQPKKVEKVKSKNGNIVKAIKNL
jgi:hypothetical protein